MHEKWCIGCNKLERFCLKFLTYCDKCCREEEKRQKGLSGINIQKEEFMKFAEWNPSYDNKKLKEYLKKEWKKLNHKIIGRTLKGERVKTYGLLIDTSTIGYEKAIDEFIKLVEDVIQNNKIIVRRPPEVTKIKDNILKISCRFKIKEEE